MNGDESGIYTIRDSSNNDRNEIMSNEISKIEEIN